MRKAVPAKNILGALLALAFLGVSGARAQNVPPTSNIEKEGQKPESAIEQQKKAAELQAEAEKHKAEEGAEVAYEQVLKDPDNIDLNYRFAQGQIRRGDLKGASATLERILTVDPNLPKVRLLYAVVLYRLDNMDEAERALNILKPQPMPETLRSELDFYLREISYRRRLTHYSALLGFGGGYDDNRNSAPNGGQVLFGDVPLQLTGDSLKKQDSYMTFLGQVGATHDLTPNGHQLFTNFTYYRTEQSQVTLLNLQSYSAQVGGVYRGSWANVTPSVKFDHVLLAQSTYLRDRSANLRLDRRNSGRLSTHAEAGYEYQDYLNTPLIPVGSQRAGPQWDFAVGADYLATPTVKLGLSYGRNSKLAASRFDAYNRDWLEFDHSWLLGRGTFLLSSLIYNHDGYGQPETALSALTRSDDGIRARVTYGAPLSLAIPRWAELLKDFMGTLTYEHFQERSNIVNYSYIDNKIGVMITYRWGI